MGGHRNKVMLFPGRDTGEGARGQAPLLPFLKGVRGSEVHVLNCFYSILAIVFQSKNKLKALYVLN